MRGLVAVFCVGVLAGLGVITLAGGGAFGAATLPDGFRAVRVAGGLDKPTAMALAPDKRIFVTEQGGALRVIQNGTLLQTPFVNLDVDSRGERGLLGVALDPDFSTNRFVYLYYTTASTPHHNQVVRFQAQGNQAVPGSEKVLLRLDNLSASQNHNSGAMHFGKDGKLYVAVGDNEDGQNAQTLSNLKGKMLRINKDGSIPEDNPFYARAKGKNRAIWAKGLRNPFSFAVQPGSGRIFINDVGQHTWEEINRGAAGANYGWPLFEGPESDPRFEPPVFAYRHDEEPGCAAITGGVFYSPQTQQFPEQFAGDYFFADFCRDWIRSYDLATDQASDFAEGLSAPIDLRVRPGGSLLYLERGTGSVNRISYAP